MSQQPILETERLLLRPLTPDDAATVARLAGSREIAHTTISIPHPYSEDQARGWIGAHTGQSATGKEIVFGVVTREDVQLIGAVGLREIDTEHSQAELGFWIAVQAWGKGYATEATRRVIRYAFEELKLNRVYAHHMVRNPASVKVLEKLGMKREGLLRQRVRKWGVFEDVVLMAILHDDWIQMSGNSP
jgi:RimJ/RimL family protein N-acetyltransferase